ncbi:unnamed protein product, partial [Heterosigma akashiwo]
MSSSDDEDYNEYDRHGRTYPFHDAAEKGDLEGLRLLLAKRKALLTGAPFDASVQPAEMDIDCTKTEINKHSGSQDKSEGGEDKAGPDSAAIEGEKDKPGKGSSSNDEDSDDSDFDPSKKPSGLGDPDDLDHDNTSALHVALLNRHLDCARLLIEEGSSTYLKCEGSPLLHVAAAQGAFCSEFSVAALRYLLEHTALSPEAKDDRGQTLLHVACAAGDLPAADFLLAQPCARAYLEARELRRWWRPLHFAAASGHRALLDRLLAAHQEHGVPTTLPADIAGRTPLHLACAQRHWGAAAALAAAGAAAGGSQRADKVGRTPGELAAQAAGGARRVPAALRRELALELEPEGTAAAAGDAGEERDGEEEEEQAPTALLYHSSCEQHYTCTPVGRAGPEPPPENINRLKVIYDQRTGGGGAAAAALAGSGRRPLAWCDSARRAELADVLRCHDYAYVERVRRVCRRLAAGGVGGGGGARIAHLDGDTAISHLSYEAALRAAGAAVEAVDRVVAGRNRNAFCAVRPPGHHAGFRGRTVLAAEREKEGSHGFCLLNNVAVAAAYARAVHRHAGVRRVAIVDFDVHHGNGTEDCVRNLVPRVEEHPVATPFATGTLAAPRYRPWLNEADARSPLVLNLGMPLHRRGVSPGLGRHELRAAYREKVFPRLHAFRPDLILVSAGFDGHFKDQINMGYLGLQEEDYYWLTEELVKLANTHCAGRLVSVLEGGYRIHGGPCSAFARSVQEHVRALADGAGSRAGWDPAVSRREGEVEARLYREREAKRQAKKLAERQAQLA